MRTIGMITAVILVSTIVGPETASAQVYDWHEANTFGYADTDNQALPKKLTLAVVLPQKMPSPAYVCMWHETDLANGNQGKTASICTITRGEDKVDKLKFSKKPNDNLACQCKRTEALKKNDLMICKMKFSGYPKLQRDSADWNWSDVAVGFVMFPEDWCG